MIMMVIIMIIIMIIVINDKSRDACAHPGACAEATAAALLPGTDLAACFLHLCCFHALELICGENMYDQDEGESSSFRITQSKATLSTERIFVSQTGRRR